MQNIIECGWVVQPVPISQSRLSGLANIPYDATQRETLLTDIHKFLKLVRGHFKTAWLEDHFQWLGPNGSGDTLEGWTHLSYLMPQYPEFQFGNLVLAQSYRNPALQAKMAATLHALSGGRVILGIGAGWKADEYRAYGFPYPSPGVRTAQLDEYTQIIKLMLAQSPASFTGKYYTIENAHNDPLPQTPIPLMIGGGGERGTLRTTAKYADWWNFPLGTADVFGKKVAVLKQHCETVGRDFDEIVLSSFNLVSLSNDPARVHRIEREVHTVGGNSDEVTRELEEFVKLGARHFMLRFLDFPNTEGIELFLSKVLPRFN